MLIMIDITNIECNHTKRLQLHATLRMHMHAQLQRHLHGHGTYALHLQLYAQVIMIMT